MTNKETRFIKTKNLSDLRAECSAEISLPDYNTDVRKILHVSAKPHPISSFASGDGVECSGEVSFEVVYLDFEGAVSSASFSGDYSFKAKCDTDSYKDSLVETTLSGLSLRLMSPRKIAARATLESSITILTEAAVVTEGDALEPSLEPQIEPTCISVRATAMTPSCEREYGCSLQRFDGKTTDEVQLIHLSVTPVVERVEVSGSEAEIMGSIKAEALVRTDDYPLCKIEKTMELSEKILLDDSFADAQPRPRIDVASAAVAVSGDEGGVELVLNVITDTRLVGEKNTTLELVGDMYLCDHPCDCVREDLAYDEYVGRAEVTREITEKMPLSELDVGKIREVVYADARGKINSAQPVESGVGFEGEIFVSAIATEIKDDGELEFTSIKFPVKFKENVNLDCHISENTTVYPDMSLLGVSVIVDAEYVYFKANVRFCVDACEAKTASILVGATAILDETYTKHPARVCVYYPEAGDTLYSVAKAYHTTKEKLLSANPGIADVAAVNGDISGAIKHLIIT